MVGVMLMGLASNRAHRAAQAVRGRLMKRIDEATQLLFDVAREVGFHEAAQAYEDASRPVQPQTEESIEAPTEKPLAKVIQLPFWPDPVRAAPSDLLRSALFGVSKKGERRPYLESQKLVSWGGASITFTGKRLDQWDEDVWLQALHLHRQQDLPSKVFTTKRAFLKAMGRPGNGGSMERLKSSLTRLVACSVGIKTPEYHYEGSLLSNFVVEEGTGRLILTLDLETVKLFEGNVAKLDWSTRMALKTDLAKWLHGYVQTHRATDLHPHRVPVEQIQRLCGSQTKLKDFKYKLKTACEQLVAQQTLASWRITPNDALELARPSRPNLKQIKV